MIRFFGGARSGSAGGRWEAAAGRRPTRHLAGVAVAWMLSLCAPTLQAAEDDPANLMLRMSAAVRALDYQGTFIYQQGNRLDALRIFHEGGGNERERLLSLSGPRSEIVREGTTMTCVQGDGRTSVFANRAGSRLLPLVPEARGPGFQKLYELKLVGEDRVAGYQAHVIDMAARDGYRYGYRLWVEDRTSMLLRSAVVDAANHPLVQFAFVTIDIGAKPQDSDLALGGPPGPSIVADETGLTGPKRWRVADPPPGFGFVRALRPLRGAEQAEHQVYSDGIANVSVYIEPVAAGSDAGQQKLARGATNLYAHTQGNWRITVLGDVPPATVERIARSVEAVPSARDTPAAG